MVESVSVEKEYRCGAKSQKWEADVKTHEQQYNIPKAMGTYNNLMS